MPVAILLQGRSTDVGGLPVTRLLPQARRRAVGPFVFVDVMGPAVQRRTNPPPVFASCSAANSTDGNGVCIRNCAATVGTPTNSQSEKKMQPIHLAGEMAVWSEEKWAAFEGDLQRQLRAERRRLQRLAARRQRAHTIVSETAAWGLFAASILLLLFY